MDLLLEDGRTAEARDALEAMGRLERTYHYDLYDGLIAKEEGNLPRALDCWKSAGVLDGLVLQGGFPGKAGPL